MNKKCIYRELSILLKLVKDKSSRYVTTDNPIYIDSESVRGLVSGLNLGYFTAGYMLLKIANQYGTLSVDEKRRLSSVWGKLMDRYL